MDFLCAEAGGVVVDDLYVEDLVVAVPEVCGEGDEGDGGGAGTVEGVACAVVVSCLWSVEHGFGEEGGADGEAVDSADEGVGVGVFVGGGDLDGVGESGLEEAGVHVDDALVDPREVIGRAGGCAGVEDGVEVAVGGDFERSPSGVACDGAGDVESVGGGEGEDGAAWRVEPADLAAVWCCFEGVGHGEVACGVGEEVAFDGPAGQGSVRVWGAWCVGGVVGGSAWHRAWF